MSTSFFINKKLAHKFIIHVFVFSIKNSTNIPQHVHKQWIEKLWKGEGKRKSELIWRYSVLCSWLTAL